MKLKYYLRGLGIGIIVTALLMGVSHKDVASAKQVEDKKVYVESYSEESSLQEYSSEYNMVEEVAASAVEEIAQLDIHNSESISQAQQYEEADTELFRTEEEQSVSEEQLPEDIAQLLEQNGDGYLEFSIVKGDDSGTVSRRLQTAGLVDNATEFDAFLMQHGYDKKISVGTVQIPYNSSWIEIAEKLSGK